ncbi:hypothetical protein BNJ_00121 [Kaumoebavirus]|uniref:hypothetical protein n=1 Tax=Kaumoebavirus TaxID=1859492 RepID=UPI0009C22647|nr:hypothetical protein BNJ_00121 [Kaumoebavirus]ARA71954.1 hypothetical protein BNJ_00121 [Kaumoebavirus]
MDRNLKVNVHDLTRVQKQKGRDAPKFITQAKFGGSIDAAAIPSPIVHHPPPVRERMGARRLHHSASVRSE